MRNQSGTIHPESEQKAGRFPITAVPTSQARRSLAAFFVATIVIVSLAMGGVPVPARRAGGPSVAGSFGSKAAGGACETLSSSVLDELESTIGTFIQYAEGVVDYTSPSRAATRRVNTLRTAEQDARELMQETIDALMADVSDSWATIGPRSLGLPGSETGTIAAMVGSTRMFITPVNLTHRRIRVTVEKLDGRQAAEVTVCRAAYRSPDSPSEVGSFTFDGGRANIGKAHSFVVDRALGEIITVKVAKNAGTNSFRYRVRTEMLGNPVSGSGND